MIWPFIHDCHFATTVDLAAGHGRNSAMLRPLADRLVIVDINQECLDSCRRRFADAPSVSYLHTNGHSLDGLATESVTLLYCFDAMVHFEPAIIDAYLREAARVLTPGGRGFFHHSNRPLPPGTDFTDAPHWRNDMSRERFAQLSRSVGLDVIRSRAIDWGQGEDRCRDLDALTLVQKP